MKLTIMRCCVAVPFATAALTANAATTQTWDLTTGDTTSPYVNAWAYTNANGKTLTLRAFYADNLYNVNDTVGENTFNRNGTLKTATQDATIKSTNGTTVAGLGSFGGSGVGISNPVDGPQTGLQENSTGGQHAIDNYDAYSSNGAVSTTTTAKHAHDFLLMDFNEAMELNSFRIGWKAYANTGIDFLVAPDSVTGSVDLAGTNVATLITQGWKTLSFNDVSDCVPDPGSAACPTQFSGGGAQYSAGMKSRFVIATGALGGNDDAFKFSQITMTSSSGGSAPIPGTAALLLVGIAGLAFTRRDSAPK